MNASEREQLLIELRIEMNAAAIEAAASLCRYRPSVLHAAVGTIEHSYARNVHPLPYVAMH